MASLIKYDRRPFGNRTLDFVRLTKFYCEFDYVPLPNPIERLVFDWVRLPNRSIRYAGEKGQSNTFQFRMLDARWEKSLALKSKQRQTQCRIQASMYLLHFSSLAKQSGHCNRRREAVCFQKSKQKDAEEPCTFPPRHTTIERPLA